MRDNSILRRTRLRSRFVIGSAIFCALLYGSAHAAPNAALKILDEWHTRQASIQDRFTLLLTAFAALDEELVPESDASLAAELNIQPPPATGLPAGVAPSAIQDSQLRAEYEAALATNQERANNAIYQHRLRDSERSAESALQALVAKATPQQLRQMKDSLHRSKLGAQRKTQVAAMLTSAAIVKK